MIMQYVIYQSSDAKFWAFKMQPWGAADLESGGHPIIHTGYIGKAQMLTNIDQWKRLTQVDIDFTQARVARQTLLNILNGQLVGQPSITEEEPQEELALLDIWD
jgi:hypothetical protein